MFIFAGITDWLDGYLARRLNQMSAFGAFLDPVADKLIVVAALLVLLYLNRVDMLVALIIIGREIAISALREWMAKVGQAASVAVAFIGKLKTVAQMVAIPLLLYHDPLLGHRLPVARHGAHQRRGGAHRGVDALLPAQGAALRLGAGLTYNARLRGNSSVGRAQPCQG